LIYITSVQKPRGILLLLDGQSLSASSGQAELHPYGGWEGSCKNESIIVRKLRVYKIQQTVTPGHPATRAKVRKPPILKNRPHNLSSPVISAKAKIVLEIGFARWEADKVWDKPSDD
jgi:hypothetical protein